MVSYAPIAASHTALGEGAEQSLTLLLQALLPGAAGTWSVRVDESWAHAIPAGRPVGVQGWKLHVAATVVSVADVLRACAPVLVEAGCHFKVARDLAQVEALTNPNCPRGNAGKILTAYPADDAQAVALARRLDAATWGLDGPRILSDRRLRPGSLVHYRYGAFTGVPHVSHDGEVGAALLGPDGDVVVDRREAGLACPSWARDPFADSAALASAALTPPASRPQQVLLGGRYAVREAIRHAYRGGVFRATDVQTGRAVVVKQARARVGTDRRGRDIQDRLREEAKVLRALAWTGVVPELFGLFEQDEDLFLAEEDLGGTSLRAWVTAGMEQGSMTRPAEQTRQVLHQVALAVARVHAAGVVLRDLGPNNIVVADDGRPRLVDLEFATFLDEAEQAAIRSGTPAYSAPEQFEGAAPDCSADSYSLGATILFAFSGEDPYLYRGGPPSTADWAAEGLRADVVPSRHLDLALRLSRADPAARARVADAVAELAVHAPEHRELTRAAAARMALDDLNPFSDDDADRAIEVLTARLLAEVRPERGRVARRSTFGETTLAANVQHGAAGLLGVLVQAWRARGGQDVHERIRSVAAWLDRAVDARTPGAPVGLYFGWAGPCWALADAGVVLGDQGLVDHAVETALALDRSFPGPDVTHGIAGLGLALVHLWEITRDARVRVAVADVAARLVRGVELEGDDVVWRTPVSAASTFAGKSFYGFAHGSAGIGTFLDAAAAVTDEPACAELAERAAATLRRAALPDDGGVLRWGSGPREPGIPLAHWCNGSSGVATFLVRHGAFTDHAALDGVVLDAEVLDGAARACVVDKWRSGIAACHGLSGNADLLLDLDRSLPGGSYGAWARDLLGVMWGRRSEDDLGVGLTDEPGRITPDFNVGYAGALSVLLRLRHGGPRLWLPEETR